ncbi:hypothetical protein [Ancylomarina longa]|uniref:Uncharacterized protein n=1 Tax=Ancylomarina longa TaxID=2487017 RepID=A0A434AG23_9BACT|nr:hypothetical protein [Ancylomarina longa]RUT73332.1 hypothetical protein DLK05_13750 [Ancylomarina longa]
MKNNDLIQVVFEPEELSENNAHLDAMLSLANKYAPGLTAEQRSEFGSINETNKLLVNKGKLIMQENPKYLPAFIDMDEFERDFVAREEIEKMLRKLDLIQRKLSDTKILLDNDNYQDVMAFYRSVRYFANEDNQEAMPLYNELKKFFPHHKNGAKEEN